VLHALLVSGLFGSTLKNKYLIYLSLPISTRILILISSTVLILLIIAALVNNISVAYAEGPGTSNVVEAAQVHNDGTAMISAGKVQTGDITNTTNIPEGLLDGPSESAAQAAALAVGAQIGAMAVGKGPAMAKVGVAVAGAAGMGIVYGLTSRMRNSSLHTSHLQEELHRLKREQAAAAEAAAADAAARAKTYAKWKESFPTKSMLEAEDLKDT